MATKQSATLLCAAIDKNGEPYTTQIVTFISPGLPYFSIIGMPDTFLSGARERIHTARVRKGSHGPPRASRPTSCPPAGTRTGAHTNSPSPPA